MTIRNDLNLKSGLKSPEGITKGFTNINSDHSAIHVGYGALASDMITLTDSEVKEYCLTAPSENYVHLKNIVLNVLGGSCKLEILKNAVVTNDSGSSVLISNPNHNSEQIPESTLKENPTYTGGADWEVIYALSDETNQFVGTSQTSLNQNQELVTKNSNEKYIIKITNLSSSNTTLTWRAFWYEEPLGIV